MPSKQSRPVLSTAKVSGRAQPRTRDVQRPETTNRKRQLEISRRKMALSSANTMQAHSDIFNSGTLVVFVGANRTQFQAYESLLRKAPFFRRRLGTLKEFELPDFSPAAFEQILYYLLNGYAKIKLSSLRGVSDQGLLDPNRDEIFRLLQTYALADKLGLDMLANDLMDVFRSKRFRWYKKAQVLVELVDHPPPNELTRDWAFETLAFEILHAESFRKYKSEHPRLFSDFFDLDTKYANAYTEYGSSQLSDYDPLYDSACAWHLHRFTPKCPRRKLINEKPRSAFTQRSATRGSVRAAPEQAIERNSPAPRKTVSDQVTAATATRSKSTGSAASKGVSAGGIRNQIVPTSLTLSMNRSQVRFEPHFAKRVANAENARSKRMSSSALPRPKKARIGPSSVGQDKVLNKELQKKGKPRAHLPH